MEIINYSRRELRKRVYKVLNSIHGRFASVNELKKLVCSKLEYEEIERIVQQSDSSVELAWLNRTNYIEVRKLLEAWSTSKVIPILETVSLQEKMSKMLSLSESDYIKDYFEKVTFIESENIFIYEDSNESKIYMSSLYMLSRLYNWMQNRVGHYMALTLRYSCQSLSDGIDVVEVYRAIQSLINVNGDELFKLMRLNGLSYIENGEAADYNKQLYGLVYDQLREIVVPHPRNVRTDSFDARESRSYEEAGFVHVLYIKYIKAEETLKEKLSRANRLARLERGGIDNMLVYIEETESSHMYTPGNGSCVKRCMDYALREDTLRILSKYTSEFDIEMISNYTSKSCTNNSLIRDNSRWCLFDWLSSRLNVEIRIQSVSCDGSRGKYKVYKRDCIDKSRVVMLYEYEILFENDDLRSSLNPYLSKEENIRMLSGKHMSVCRENKFSMRKFRRPLARILDFDEVDEDLANEYILSSLRELNTNSSSSSSFQSDVFYFDIETRTCNQTIGEQIGRVHGSDHVFRNINEDLLENLSTHGRAITSSIQICNNERNVRIFKCMNVVDSWKDAFDWIYDHSTKIYDFKNSKLISNVLMYGFNSSRFDNYKFLDDVKGK